MFAEKHIGKQTTRTSASSIMWKTFDRIMHHRLTEIWSELEINGEGSRIDLQLILDFNESPANALALRKECGRDLSSLLICSTCAAKRLWVKIKGLASLQIGEVLCLVSYVRERPQWPIALRCILDFERSRRPETGLRVSSREVETNEVVFPLPSSPMVLQNWSMEESKWQDNPCVVSPYA